MNIRLVSFILTIWTALVTGALIFLYWKVYLDLNTTTQTQTNINQQVQTLNTAFSTLNTTTTQTVQSLTIGYDGQDILAFIDVQGSNALSGYIYTNQTFDQNMTTLLSADTFGNCSSCSTQLFYKFNVNEIGCCSFVYMSSDLNTICLRSELSLTPEDVCVNVQVNCKYITISNLNVNTLKNKAVLYLSYGTICA